MNIANAYGPGKFGLSFELFPPKTAEGEAELFRHLPELMSFDPGYVTCTYGAGGSTRTRTLDIVARVRSEFGCAVASHLTCVGSTVEDLRAYLAEARSRGVGNVVALRGDPPKGSSSFEAAAGGFRYANQLVELIRAEFAEFGVAVAGYPEVHQEAKSAGDDLANLKRKVDAGADVVITQLFYSNDDFFKFRDRCLKAGICVPIIPGVLPVTNLAQIQRITNLCGARLPEDFVAALSAQDPNSDAQFDVGVEFATRQVQELIDAGVPGVHFYVLNRSTATARVLRSVTRFA